MPDDFEEYCEALDYLVDLYMRQGAVPVEKEELQVHCQRLLDEWMELLWMVPTKPGMYFDGYGCLWALSHDGHWMDNRRIIYEPWHRLFLSMRGPWVEKEG